MFDFLGGLGSALGGAVDFIGDIGGDIWGGIQGLGSSIWDLGQTAWGGIEDLFGGGGAAGTAAKTAGEVATQAPKLDLGGLAALGYQLFQQNRQAKMVEDLYKQTVQQADPFAQYKPATAARLNELLTNPSTIVSSPSYEFRRQQGEQGVNRALAARGYRLSGNQLQALADYNQAFASTEYEAEVERLRKLLGASGAEGVLSNLGLAGVQARQGRDETIGQIIRGIGSRF